MWCGCLKCNSPQVVAPPEFTEDAHFYCAACGQDLGTWGSFKREAKQYPPRRARVASPAN